MKKLFAQGLLRFAAGVVLLGTLLFGSAGTLRWRESGKRIWHDETPGRYEAHCHSAVASMPAMLAATARFREFSIEMSPSAAPQSITIQAGSSVSSAPI